MPSLRPRASFSFDSFSRLVAAAICAALLATTGCQGDVESRLAEIQALQEAGEWEASIEPLRGLLASNSSHAEINYRLGIALLQTGRRSLAVWPLQKATESDEYRVQAGMLLATTLLATEDNEEAIAAATRVLEAEPENVAALQARARAKIKAVDAGGALEDIERALEIDPDDRISHTVRIGALIDLDRFDEAGEAHIELARVDELGDDAELAARSCGGLAIFYEGQQKLDEARAQYLYCLEKYPDSLLIRGWVAEFHTKAGEIDAAAAVWRDAIDATPENPNLRANLAQLLETNGRAAEASAVYRESVELFDDVASWRVLSTHYRRTGKVDEARAALREAIERAPGEPVELRFELADLLVEAGEIAEAQKIADAIEESAYKDLLQGRILLAQRKPAEALEKLEAGLRRWPNNAGARYLAGVAALEIGDEARARGEFREAFRADDALTNAGLELARMYYDDADFTSARQFAANFIEKRPFIGPEAHIIASRSARAMGEYEVAERILNDLLSKPGHEAIAWAEVADLAAKGLSSEKAIEALQNSGLDLSAPANEIALRSLTNAWLKRGNPERALNHINEAIAANPELASYYELRARVLLAKGDTAAARASLDRALAIDPGNGSALEVLGTITAAKGDIAGALGIFERAVAAAPLNAENRYKLARAQLATGKQAEAIANLRETIALDALHAEACNDLAWLLADGNDDLDLALDLARRSVKVARGADSLDTLGFVQLKRGDAADAVSTFERALKVRSDSASIRYRLGVALAAAGRTAEAREALKAALAAGDFPEAEAAQAELARLGSADASDA